MNKIYMYEYNTHVCMSVYIYMYVNVCIRIRIRIRIRICICICICIHTNYNIRYIHRPPLNLTCSRHTWRQDSRAAWIHILETLSQEYQGIFGDFGAIFTFSSLYRKCIVTCEHLCIQATIGSSSALSPIQVIQVSRLTSAVRSLCRPYEPLVTLWSSKQTQSWELWEVRKCGPAFQTFFDFFPHIGFLFR